MYLLKPFIFYPGVFLFFFLSRTRKHSIVRSDFTLLSRKITVTVYHLCFKLRGNLLNELFVFLYIKDCRDSIARKFLNFINI